MGSDGLFINRYGVSFGANKPLLQVQSGDGCITLNILITTQTVYFQRRMLWHVNYISIKLWQNVKTFGWFILQVTQAVAKLGMSQIPQKDLLETVRVREQVTTKRSKQELPPPPPPKKRQIPVDLEAKKKWEQIETFSKHSTAHNVFVLITNHMQI